MKRLTSAVLAAALTLVPSCLYSDVPDFSGLLSTRLGVAHATGTDEDFMYGSEIFANLRMRASVGEYGTIHAAVNLISLTGVYALQALAARELERVIPGAASPPGGFTTGENMATALELERLFVQFRFDAADVDLGLMRLAFGYGQAFRPLDFLNPPNPLLPDSRPRGIPAVNLTVYPGDNSRLAFFSAVPGSSLSIDGSGTRSGIAADWHGTGMSFQGLYTYISPYADHRYGVHSIGASIKLDYTVALVGEALWLLDPQEGPDIEGLRCAAGIDGSAAGGSLYLLGQYLFNGDRSGASAYTGRHLAFTQALYRFNDYHRAFGSVLYGIEDVSAVASLGYETEPFQALTLATVLRVPMDRKSVGISGQTGELGPGAQGARYLLTLSAVMRF